MSKVLALSRNSHELINWCNSIFLTLLVADVAEDDDDDDDAEDDEDILSESCFCVAETEGSNNKLRWILTSTCEIAIKINDITIVVVLDSFPIVSDVLLAAFNDETSPGKKKGYKTGTII